MKFDLKIGEGCKSLEWRTGEGPDRARVRVDGAEMALGFQTVDPHQYFLTVDGRPARVFVAPGVDGTHVFIKGVTYRVRAAEPARGRKQRNGTEESPGQVTPPMPAVVVRILVREGEAVTRGQGLLVVSAMKMETTLKAPYDGVVKKINAALQDKVMPGDRLVEIEAGEGR